MHKEKALLRNQASWICVPLNTILCTVRNVSAPRCVHVTVRWTRVEGSGFLLRDLLDFAVELTGGGLVEFNAAGQTTGLDGIQEAQRADTVHVSGVLGQVKGDLGGGEKRQRTKRIRRGKKRFLHFELPVLLKLQLCKVFIQWKSTWIKYETGPKHWKWFPSQGFIISGSIDFYIKLQLLNLKQEENAMWRRCWMCFCLFYCWILRNVCFVFSSCFCLWRFFLAFVFVVLHFLG